MAEMGARREGDVRLLCDVARPDAVVVTNVGTAHLGIFGSWDAIVRAGAEPVECARRRRHGDRERGRPGRARLRRGHRGGRDHVRSGRRRRRAGRGRRAGSRRAGGLHPHARPANASRWSSPSRASTWCRTPSPPRRSAGGPASRSPSARRRSRRAGVRAGGWRRSRDRRRTCVVNDAYNANPESMAAALKSRALDGQGRALVAVLGHMAELGPIAFEEHERMGELVVRIGVERLIAVGDDGRTIARAAIREGAGCPRTSRRTTSRRGRGRRPRMGEARRRRARRRGRGSRVSNAWRRPFDDARPTTRCAREADPDRRRGRALGDAARHAARDPACSACGDGASGSGRTARTATWRRWARRRWAAS